jgi:hypothetical protein
MKRQERFMVFRRFRRKSEGEASETPSHDDIGDLDRDGIQARLREIRQEIEALKEEGPRLIKEKAAGRLHDTEYNVSTTAISMRVQNLRKIEQALLTRIEEIQQNIGQNALKSS